MLMFKRRSLSIFMRLFSDDRSLRFYASASVGAFFNFKELPEMQDFSENNSTEKTCCAICGKVYQFYYTKTSDDKLLCKYCSAKAGIPYIRTIDDVYPSLDELKQRIKEREEAEKNQKVKKIVKTITITKTIVITENSDALE